MKQFILLIGIVLTCASARAQSISQEVIASSGAYFSNSAAGDLHWTVGEAMTETFEHVQILSQGFHQIFEIITSLNGSYLREKLDIRVFPNPVRTWLNVRAKFEDEFQGIIFDSRGHMVLSIRLQDYDNLLDVRSLPPGIYYLHIRSTSHPVRTFKFVK